MGSSPTFGTPLPGWFRAVQSRGALAAELSGDPLGRVLRHHARGALDGIDPAPRIVNEDYHLQVQGERRGPYTLRQIDHMLQTGLIPSEALFLREGMEDWQPVTGLVRLREPVNLWKRRLILAGCAVVLLLLGRFFGPTVVEGWRESAQKEFTEHAAYWSARDAIRQGALPHGSLIKFGKFNSAQVLLQPEPPTASVGLSAEVLGNDGHFRAATWQVTLSYNNLLKRWTPGKVQEMTAK